MIIDESDDEINSFPNAIELGYSGTSHKNCKGIFKTLAAAAHIRVRSNDSRRLLLSAEDLVNAGPIALMQDLAVVAALGIEHVERNGHHYYKGLSMFPRSVQDSMIENHGDLFHRNPMGFAAVNPIGGRLKLESINDAIFGYAIAPEMMEFDRWKF